jgi:hypothetical protein
MASAATEAAPLDSNAVQLFAMSAAMFVGAFAAGYFPILLNLSSDRYRPSFNLCLPLLSHPCIVADFAS